MSFHKNNPKKEIIFASILLSRSGNNFVIFSGCGIPKYYKNKILENLEQIPDNFGVGIPTQIEISFPYGEIYPWILY